MQQLSDFAFRGLCACAIVLAGAVAYVNTFDGDWVWDDASSVLLHEHVQDPAKLPELFTEDQHAFGRGEGNFYRPLLSVSFMVDYQLSHAAEDSDGALAPFVFHVQNLMWHLAAGISLLLLLGRLGAPRVVLAIVPLFFVLHPLHTEAVAYISGRADMMSGTFILLGLYFCLSRAADARALLSIVAGIICFVLGLLSKESTLIFPVLLALVLLLSNAKSGKENRVLQNLKPLLPAIAVLVGYIALRATVLNFATQQASMNAPLTERLVETCQAFAFYIQKLFLPTALHMEQTLDGVPRWTAILGVLFLIAIVVAIVLAWRTEQRRIALGFAWFLAAWLPISGIFPLNAPMAEHWMYVPMAGFWWALVEIAWLLGQKLPATRPVSLALAGALCLLFAVLTIQRNADWHDNVQLFRETLAENPESRRVQYNLAVAYEDLVENYPGARRHFRNALDLTQAAKPENAGIGPEELEMYISLGQTSYAMNDYQAAVNYYASPASALKVDAFRNEAAFAAFELGRSQLALGNLYEATKAFEAAAQVNPSRMAELQALLANAPL